MGLEMTGIDHESAGIEIREKFSFTKKKTGELLKEMMRFPGMRGCAVITTCSRTEIWISTGPEWDGGLYDKMCAACGMDKTAYKDYFTARRERNAVRHLFRLSSGLESRILGEDQILTQVRDAIALAREAGTADNVLETLFRQAVTAAKKIKTEIVLPHADRSVVGAMVRELKSGGMTFSGKKCLVIGNGVMGRLAAAELLKEGAFVTMTVRSYHRGEVTVPKGCEKIDYERRAEAIEANNCIISATVSPHYTLTSKMAKQHVKGGTVLIDLAVPEDIEPSVGALPGIRLYNVDSFRQDALGEEQKKAVAAAERMLEGQMEEFFSWYDNEDLIPRVVRLKGEIAEDMAARLEKKLRALPVEDAARQALKKDIEKAVQNTANRMLFGLMDGCTAGTLRECVECLEGLYEK